MLNCQRFLDNKYLHFVYLHDNRTLLTPYAFGGVLRLHIWSHSILDSTCDVLLDHVGTVVSVGTAGGNQS